MTRRIGPSPSIAKVSRRLARAVRQPAQRVRGVGRVNFRGRGVVNLIDVGSAGQLPEPWHTHSPKIKSLLKFEPRDTPADSPNVRTVDAALWSEESERDLYVYQGLNGSGSSLFKQNVGYVTANYETLKDRGSRELAETWLDRAALDRAVKVRCRTLDAVLDDGPPIPYHFLKADVQGAEYEVLLGAGRYLERDCLGLHLELFTLPLYEGITLMDGVVAFLDERGFSLERTNKPHGTFDSQHDCVFLRRGSTSQELMEIRRVYDL